MFSNRIVDTLALGLVLCQTILAASSADWRSRTIYQVLTDRFARSDGSTTASCQTADRAYCGGTWRGIQNHLDYIQGMGFDAVWISPITAQLQGQTPDGSSYHGYWQQDIYALNSAFGTADDLKSLSAALHARGMYLMVDVVVNHNAYWGSPSSIDYSKFTPFNDEKYYHPYCAINYSDENNAVNMEQCWEGDTTVPLPDLRTEDTYVANTWNSWISNLVKDYGIDGLRMDSAIEVDPQFWAGWQNAAGVYVVGETYEADANYVCGFQKVIDGVLNYPTYFPLVQAFQSTSGSISNLANMINNVKSDCQDTSLIGTFSENHDQPRFASLTGDMSLARNVVAFTVLADGIPIIYEGQEQHYNALGGSSDPYNREAVWYSNYNTQAPLYELIATLNKARKHAISDDGGYLAYMNYPIYTDTTTIAMRKGKMVTVLSNKGANGAAYSQTIASGYAGNTGLTELLTCSTLTADGSGKITVPMANGQPRIYYPTASLSGSGLCGGGSSGSTSSGSTSSGSTSSGSTSSGTTSSSGSSTTTSSSSSTTSSSSSNNGRGQGSRAAGRPFKA
ncbi:hypothetical protein LTR78_001470 [Recurvomyces mirabilis]|uniref:alpha-amylase n=1 Tax=Recurvomyces mirabilis TaxID=574656 RepID=A0AAE0WWE2_9PEZI|nr:hypothetical protein LTR78_001470 [Recurvomyces mirabilis]KAK5161449.1 hypothetical protein LTS14_001245 [Recurvomyces mirabilis]